MSKYSEKIERQIREARRIAENMNRRGREKKETWEMKKEKKEVRNRIKEIDKTENEEKEKDRNLSDKRKKLREAYLEALKVSDIRQINHAKSEILKFEINKKITERES